MIETATLVDRFRAVGERRYHDKHPFHQALVAGALTQEQVQSWILNRYYYQKIIPIKDAAILANLPTAEHRRVWIKRLIDHDGAGGSAGGTEKWLRLAEAAGLSRERVLSEADLSPTVRFAADAYVTFTRTRPWLEAVASSLTEMFVPPVLRKRVEAMLARYSWIDPRGYAYFEDRMQLAKTDADTALSWVVDEAQTIEQQDACVAALEFKCDVLWSILDGTALDSGFFHA